MTTIGFTVIARLLVLCAALAVVPRAAGSPAAPALPAWEQLSPSQREQLVAPIRERWNAEPGKRQRMLEHARRWQDLTPEQRGRAHHGMNRWQDMTPEQREQMRALYATMRTLPDEERGALKARWKRMSPEQRRAWVQAHPPQRRDGEAKPRD